VTFEARHGLKFRLNIPERLYFAAFFAFCLTSIGIHLLEKNSRSHSYATTLLQRDHLLNIRTEFKRLNTNYFTQAYCWHSFTADCVRGLRVWINRRPDPHIAIGYSTMLLLLLIVSTAHAMRVIKPEIWKIYDQLYDVCVSACSVHHILHPFRQPAPLTHFPYTMTASFTRLLGSSTVARTLHSSYSGSTVWLSATSRKYNSLSAETESEPKVSIWLSAVAESRPKLQKGPLLPPKPKPKPNFGRPLAPLMPISY